jgi:hypothetical protein
VGNAYGSGPSGFSFAKDSGRALLYADPQQQVQHRLDCFFFALFFRCCLIFWILKMKHAHMMPVADHATFVF